MGGGSPVEDGCLPYLGDACESEGAGGWWMMRACMRASVMPRRLGIEWEVRGLNFVCSVYIDRWVCRCRGINGGWWVYRRRVVSNGTAQVERVSASDRLPTNASIRTHSSHLTSSGLDPSVYLRRNKDAHFNPRARPAATPRHAHAHAHCPSQRRP